MNIDMEKLETLLKFMRRHGILEFESDGVKLKLSDAAPDLAEEIPLTEEAKAEAREESLMELEDRLLLESPSDFERLKSEGALT